MAKQLQWISWSAPLVLVPKANIASWYGMFAPLENLDPDDIDEDLVRVMADGERAMPWEEFDFSDPRSHYEEACEALDGDLFADGPAGSLVIGEELTLGTFLPDELGGLFVGVVWGEPAAHESALAGDLDVELASAMHWELPTDGAVWLSAADIADPQWLAETGNSALETALKAGMYDVWTGAWTPDDETRFELIRLVRLPEE